jgi:hypothetical protein
VGARLQAVSGDDGADEAGGDESRHEGGAQESEQGRGHFS